MNKLLVAAALGIAVSAAAPASADQIDFKNVGTHASVVQISVNNTAEWVWAGELDWKWITPAGAADFYTYCADVLNFLTDPQYVNVKSTSQMPDPYNTDGNEKAAWLVNTYADTIRNSADTTDWDTAAGALQVAIWELLTDATPDLANGTFKLLSGGDVGALAQSILNYVNTVAYQGSTAIWLDSYSPTGGAPGQDQIMRTPEPGTLLLLGLGGAALFRKRRRLAARQ